jgi:hypothetical protein
VASGRNRRLAQGIGGTVRRCKISHPLTRAGELDRRIFDMWLACYTQEQIAEACGCHKDTVSEITENCRKKFSETKSDKSAMDHATDFEPPRAVTENQMFLAWNI